MCEITFCEDYYNSSSIRYSNSIQGFPHIDFTWEGRPGILTAAQVYFVTHLFILFLILFLMYCERNAAQMWVSLTQGDWLSI